MISTWGFVAMVTQLTDLNIDLEVAAIVAGSQLEVRG